VFFYKKKIMENSKSTPISSKTSTSGSPSTSKDHKSSTPPSTSPAKGVGGDQKSGTKASDVVKESKDITAA
jgi:hypothetical protein